MDDQRRYTYIKPTLNPLNPNPRTTWVIARLVVAGIASAMRGMRQGWGLGGACIAVGHGAGASCENGPAAGSDCTSGWGN